VLQFLGACFPLRKGLSMALSFSWRFFRRALAVLFVFSIHSKIFVPRVPFFCCKPRFERCALIFLIRLQLDSRDLFSQCGFMRFKIFVRVIAVP